MTSPNWSIAGRFPGAIDQLRVCQDRTVVPFPNDNYMRALAEAHFALSYLEWAVLGDLSRLSQPPPGLSVAKLSRSTLGHKLKVLESAETSAPNGEKEWLRAAVEALKDVIDARNKVVHANPATVANELIL